MPGESEKSGSGDVLQGEAATEAHRGIAMVNYMAQDRPDLSATARGRSQGLANPTTGTEECVKGTIRHLASHPR